MMWHSPPETPVLASDEVHVWRVPLNRPSSEMPALRRLLSADELDCANRFHFSRNRENYTVAHAALRLILGRYVGLEPSGLQFGSGVQGKPFLLESPASQDIRFNLSHSHELALYSVSVGREIGVDIEFIRSDPDIDISAIAERFFSLDEREALLKLPPSMRKEGFYNCWTRKEAYIKARGEGLSLPLDQFSVSFKPGERAALVRVAEDPGEIANWRLQELFPSRGYAAAIAVQGYDW